MVLLNVGDQIQAVAVGQAHVGETQIEALGLQEALCAGDIARGLGLNLHATQRQAHKL